MIDYQDVTVTVPVDAIQDLLSYAARLHTGSLKVPDGGAVALDEDAVRQAYLGGTDNKPWRDLLEVLAEHAGNEVYWPELCEAIGLGRRSGAGVIGAAERRCKRNPPYTKRYAGEDTWFTMSPEVATVIKKVAAVQH